MGSNPLPAQPASGFCEACPQINELGKELRVLRKGALASTAGAKTPGMLCFWGWSGVREFLSGKCRVLCGTLPSSFGLPLGWRHRPGSEDSKDRWCGWWCLLVSLESMGEHHYNDAIGIIVSLLTLFCTPGTWKHGMCRRCQRYISKKP